jgi:hypothetical protein
LAFSYILPDRVFSNSSTDGAFVNAWPHFPVKKVGQMFIYSSFWLFGGFDFK